MDFKTEVTLFVTLLATLGTWGGHSIPPDQQSALIAWLMGLGTIVSIIGPVAAAVFHRLHATKQASVIKDLSGVVAADNPNPTQPQKAGSQ
jgi:hypothetical protein